MSSGSTAFLGTSGFAAEVLSALTVAGRAPDLVITPPDRRRGRGRRLGSPPAAERARELGLDLHQTASVGEPGSVALIRERGVELALVCAFGQLIKPPLLDELELLNVHPSLLPRWRGAAPIERALMAGDRETGVAVMQLVAELDAGPVALLERTPIGERETFGELSARLASIGGGLLVEALARRERGELRFEPQAEDGLTYAEKIEPRERRIDPGRPARELDLQIRALTPHIGAYAELPGGERLGIVSARPLQGGPAPGVVEDREGALLVGCAEGALNLEVVQPPGKRAMNAVDYLRGNEPPRSIVSG